VYLLAFLPRSTNTAKILQKYCLESDVEKFYPRMNEDENCFKKVK
jgi:hypothetical protein